MPFGSHRCHCISLLTSATLPPWLYVISNTLGCIGLQLFVEGVDLDELKQMRADDTKKMDQHIARKEVEIAAELTQRYREDRAAEQVSCRHLPTLPPLAKSSLRQAPYASPGTGANV